jgi:AcrR family transcriptional regulator
MPVQKITREGIIAKSIEVFLLKGYHNASMDDLAKACNLQKGSFYHYYKSKEDLMKSVLTEALHIANTSVFSCAYITDLPAEDRLRLMFLRQEKMFKQFNTGCLFGNTVLETVFTVPEFREILISFFEKWEEALIHIYTSRYNKTQAKMLAINTIGQIEGVLMLSLLRNNTKILEQTYKSILVQFSKT